MTTDKQKKLEELFRYDWMARQAERELTGDADSQGLACLLRAATEQAGRERGQEEAEARLEVLASLWSQVGTKDAARMLAELALDPNAAVRHAAGEGLAELAAEKYDLFASTVRGALSRQASFLGAEVEDLAFLISGIDDPQVVDLILTMLDHGDEHVTVAALEVAGEWAWDERVPAALARLEQDTRRVTLDDADEGQVTVGISELAAQVAETVRSLGGAGK